MSNFSPEQKIWIKCLLKGEGNSNFLLRGVIWHLFNGNGTKIKITSEIKPPLNVFDTCLLKGLTQVKDARIRKLMGWLRNSLSLKFSKSSSIHWPRPIVTYDKLIIVSWSKWRQLGGSFFKTCFSITYFNYSQKESGVLN